MLVGALTVELLDRARHGGLIDAIRNGRAGTLLLLDGDVGSGIEAASLGGGLDVRVGTGPAQRGCHSVRRQALGGFVRTRPALSDED